MSDFELDSRLAANSVLVDQGPLSQVRLMNDERYPWLVLVPRVTGITEWLELDGHQQQTQKTISEHAAHRQRPPGGASE